MRLEIDGEFAGIRFSACHFIAGHRKCGRLHGHTYVVSLKLHGDMGKDGMVMDFIPLKKELRAIAEELDHRVLVPANSKNNLGAEEVFIRPTARLRPAQGGCRSASHGESSAELPFHPGKGHRERRFPGRQEVEVGVHEELGQTPG